LPKKCSESEYLQERERERVRERERGRKREREREREKKYLKERELIIKIYETTSGQMLGTGSPLNLKYFSEYE
jgi:hypothetical protein